MYMLERRWEILRHYFDILRRILEEEKHRQLRMFVILDASFLIGKSKHEKPKTVRTPENIAAVAECECEAPSTSIHRRSQQLNISVGSLRRILHKVLGMTPCKVQLVQDLKSIDHPLSQAYFDLGEYVNKQNCRIWGTENPHAYFERPTHSKRATVWCGFWFKGIISHFSSKMSKERPLQS